MSAMEIRRMQRRDLAQVLTLYSELMTDADYAAHAEEHFIRLQQLENTHLLIAVQGDDVLGTALGVICQGLTERFLVVEDVVVHPAARGQGVGMQLMDALDEIARRGGCTYAILVSSAFRTGAHAFYHRAGYTDTVVGFRKLYQ